VAIAAGFGAARGGAVGVNAVAVIFRGGSFGAPEAGPARLPLTYLMSFLVECFRLFGFRRAYEILRSAVFL